MGATSSHVTVIDVADVTLTSTLVGGPEGAK